jgi:hypothetical protein
VIALINTTTVIVIVLKITIFSSDKKTLREINSVTRTKHVIVSIIVTMVISCPKLKNNKIKRGISMIPLR